MNCLDLFEMIFAVGSWETLQFVPPLPAKFELEGE